MLTRLLPASKLLKFNSARKLGSYLYSLKYRSRHNNNNNNNNNGGWNWNGSSGPSLVTGGACALILLSVMTQVLLSQRRLQAKSAAEAMEKEYTAEEVGKHTSAASGGIWVSYQGRVYDITNFIEAHPGGRAIYLAVGKDIEPFWKMYNVHLISDTALNMLKPYDIGRLKAPAAGPTAAPCMMTGTVDKANDYDFVLKRDPRITVLSQKPFNAEPPSPYLTQSFTTPPELAFVRSHIHTPKIDAEKWSLEIAGLGMQKSKFFTFSDLRSTRLFPETRKVMMAMQCAGNRRETLAAVQIPDSPLAYKHGVMHNTIYTGVSVKDVFERAGIDIKKLEASGAKHVIFEGQDHNGVEAFHESLPLEKAFDPDTILAWEMNGAPLLPDHGYPARLVAPGLVGQRSVKWLKRIVFSPIEAQSFWQQKDKIMPPWNPAPENNPSMMELPVQSAICDPVTGSTLPADVPDLTLKGYAWSGGGRGIQRVDLTSDEGRTWTVSKLTPPPQESWNRVWGWTLWEGKLPLPKATGYTQKMHVCARAVDSAYNVQPESPLPLVNQRGFGCNCWHCVDIIVPPRKK